MHAPGGAPPRRAGQRPRPGAERGDARAHPEPARRPHGARLQPHPPGDRPDLRPAAGRPRRRAGRPGQRGRARRSGSASARGVELEIAGPGRGGGRRAPRPSRACAGSNVETAAGAARCSGSRRRTRSGPRWPRPRSAPAAGCSGWTSRRTAWSRCSSSSPGGERRREPGPPHRPPRAARLPAHHDRVDHRRLGAAHRRAPVQRLRPGGRAPLHRGADPVLLLRAPGPRWSRPSSSSMRLLAEERQLGTLPAALRLPGA